MIKGINRQMIEVTHTGSPYFERAYFVVRTDYGQPSDETLQHLADKLVQQANTYSALKRQRRRLQWRRVGQALGAAAVGAAVAVTAVTVL